MGKYSLEYFEASTIHRGSQEWKKTSKLHGSTTSTKYQQIARKNVHFHGRKLSVCMGSTMNISNILGLVRRLFSRSGRIVDARGLPLRWGDGCLYRWSTWQSPARIYKYLETIRGRLMSHDGIFRRFLSILFSNFLFLRNLTTYRDTIFPERLLLHQINDRWTAL